MCTALLTVPSIYPICNHQHNLSDSVQCTAAAAARGVPTCSLSRAALICRSMWGRARDSWIWSSISAVRYPAAIALSRTCHQAAGEQHASRCDPVKGEEVCSTAGDNRVLACRSVARPCVGLVAPLGIVPSATYYKTLHHKIWSRHCRARTALHNQ